MTTGEKIKLHRKQLGFTQTELGDKLGVKKNAVSKWECGRVDDVPTSKVKQLADIFNVAPSYLIDEDEPSLEVNPFSRAPTNLIPLPKTKKIPLLGDIACGDPILADENITDYISADEGIHADFALMCKGDSMINARIFDGDIVYIRAQPTVENGQIAAVLIDNEATLKRVRMFDDHIVLEPENPTFRPLAYWGEEMSNVRIIGKAVAFTSVIR